MTILLIDGTNLFIRNFTVVPALSIHGESIGGVVGTLSSLKKIIKLTVPDKVIIAWDGVGGSRKRRNIVEDYKKSRKPLRLNRNYEHETLNPEQNKINQRLRLSEYLSDLPVTEIAVDDIEADDIIGHLHSFYNKHHKVIVSSDKDFYQLLDSQTIIYSHSKKMFLTAKYVREEFKIHPCNFALARAFVGDKSDNISGVKGIGFKKLIKLLPFLSEKDKVTVDQLTSLANLEPEKYKVILNNADTISRNLKVMKLDGCLIGFCSIQKIQEHLLDCKLLNATSIRVKLMEDGIVNLSEDFFNIFKALEIRQLEMNNG